MFSDTTLHAIRSRLDIVEVIGEYLPLKKSGSDYSALCPFHKEKTPSFHIHPVKQCFHCFGCHKGGNVFTFVGAMEGISFPETVRKLAERTGVTLDEKFSKWKAQDSRTPERDRLFSAMDWAAKYYHYLLTEVAEYQAAKAYLKERGISDQTIKRFRLGVAPTGWHTLSPLMLNRGFSEENLVEAGLIVKKDNGKGTYDRFRDRIMFPIRNSLDRILGFGARIYKPTENQPKYINSVESALFSKRRHLYGIYEAQREIRVRGEALVVEGYMDVIGLYEKGVANAVATMGTALTDDHCQGLKRLTRRVVTVFDPDSAGRDAWRRSVELFVANGIFAKDLQLPGGLDPDEYVLKEGAEKFYELCQKAPRQVTKLLKEIASQGALSEEQRASALEMLAPLLVATRRSHDRATLWDSISLVLNVSVEILKEIGQGSADQREKHRHSARSSRSSVRIQKSPPAVAELDPLDFQFLQAVLKAMKEFQATPKSIWETGLRDKRCKIWLERLHAAENSVDCFSVLEEMVRDEAHPQLLSVASEGLMETKPAKGDQQLFDLLLARVKKRGSELEIKRISTEIRLAQKLGDEPEQLRLLEKLKAIRQET